MSLKYEQGENTLTYTGTLPTSAGTTNGRYVVEDFPDSAYNAIAKY